MTNLKLTRVDNRYIHGQVSARLVRQFGISRIVLVSDLHAADPFMSELYQAMAIGFDVDVVSVAEAAQKWADGDYATERAIMLLWGTIADASATYNAGIRYDFLALANIPGEAGKLRVNDSCYINADEAAALRALAAAGVDVYFQALTDLPKTTLDDALRSTGL